MVAFLFDREGRRRSRSGAPPTSSQPRVVPGGSRRRKERSAVRVVASRLHRRSFPRRLPRWGFVAFFVCGLVDGRECEALWQTDTLIIDEPLLDRAMVVEALGETYYLPRLGLSSPCFVDTGQPHVLMLTLVRALDVVHDIRAARADDPDTWMQLVCP